MKKFIEFAIFVLIFSAGALTRAEAQLEPLKQKMLQFYPDTLIELEHEQEIAESFLKAGNFNPNEAWDQGNGMILLKNPNFPQGQLVVRFHAWKPCWMSVRRISPKEALTSENVIRTRVDVSQGIGRSIRTTLLAQSEDLSKLQSIGTFLPDRPISMTDVEFIPDVKLGQTVRLELRSSSVSLSTDGIAQEPGYFNKRLRVLSSRTKKILEGKLTPEGVVEVRL